MGKKILSYFLAIAMLFSLVNPIAYADTEKKETEKNQQQVEFKFKDVKESDWFFDSVNFVVEKKIMNGVEETKFSPKGLATRAMIVTVLYRIDGAPKVEGKSIFSDVEQSKWYYDAINWASKNKVVNGYEDKTFKPNKNISRQDFAKILYNYSAYKQYDIEQKSDLKNYEDANEISDYAKEAMAWANKLGLITGVTKTTLVPKANASRAEIATIFARFYKNIPAKELAFDDEKTPLAKGEKKSEKSEKNKEDDEKYGVLQHGEGSGRRYPSSSNNNKKCTVIFDTQFSEDNNIEKQIINKGGYAEEPEVAGRENYFFAGWFVEKQAKDLAKPFNFKENKIEGNLTLYANWINLDQDTDEDGLSDDLELYAGTEVDNKDTDGDGLTDHQELVILGTNPLLKDSNNDGTIDYDEDNDKDGIKNGQEFILGTNPVRSDSDNDELSDSDELETYQTNPTEEDTDGDGANDGWEIANGYDPLVANDQFVCSFEAPEPSSEEDIDENMVTAGVQNLITESGKPAEITVNAIDVVDNYLVSNEIEGYLGSAYEFNSSEDISSAELVFLYDSSLGEIGDDFQPRIYYVNPETQGLEELENQVVEDGKVIATVNHFSTYLLLNKVKVDAIWNEEIKLPKDNNQKINGIDIAFVIDSSGSMDDNDRNNLRLSAAKDFVKKLGENDRAAVIDFDGDAVLCQGFTSDQDLLNQAIDGIDSDGGTSLSAGMSLAIEQFLNPSNKRDDVYKYIIFLTDGDGDYDTSYTEQAIQNNIVVYTVGLGSGVKENKLINIAESTGGKYYIATSAGELGTIYDKVSEETIDFEKDSNNDGICDYYSDKIMKGELTLINGSKQFQFSEVLSPTSSSDYDEDGLKNGEELKVEIINDKYVKIKMISNPCLKDSDGDGTDDKIEIEKGRDPLCYDVKADGLDKLMNAENFVSHEYVEFVNKRIAGKVNSFGREVFAVVYGVWDKEKIYRHAMVTYFSSDSKKLVKKLQKKYAKYYCTKASYSILKNLRKKLKDGIEFTDDGKTIVSLIKDTHEVLDRISDGERSKQVVKELTNIAKSLDSNKIAIKLKGFSNKKAIRKIAKKMGGVDKVKTLKRISLGISVAVAVKNVGETISDFAKVSANEAAFGMNIDILKKVSTHSKDERARNAAEDIVLHFEKNYVNTMFEIAKSIEENVGNIAINQLIGKIASKNIYVAIASLVVDAFDILSGVSTDIKQAYETLAYEEMARATQKVLKKSLRKKGENYLIKQEHEFIRLGSNLVQLRMLANIKLLKKARYDGWLPFVKNFQKWVLTKTNVMKELEKDQKLLKKIAKKYKFYITNRRVEDVFN